jgi:hypothetical protein
MFVRLCLLSLLLANISAFSQTLTPPHSGDTTVTVLALDPGAGYRATIDVTDCSPGAPSLLLPDIQNTVNPASLKMPLKLSGPAVKNYSLCATESYHPNGGAPPKPNTPATPAPVTVTDKSSPRKLSIAQPYDTDQSITVLPVLPPDPVHPATIDIFSVCSKTAGAPPSLLDSASNTALDGSGNNILIALKSPVSKGSQLCVVETFRGPAPVPDQPCPQ